jgi:putative hemolysin
MNQVLFEVIVIFVLLVANGIFAMAEIAVVSANKPRLRRLAEQGLGNARAALDLAEAPNRFLATVQIGITLVGIFAGAFGGATLATKLAAPISQSAVLAPYADKIALGIVVAAITYFSLVLGELVPKHLGLRSPERVAMALARPMHWLSRVAGPVVTFLTASTEGLLRRLGLQPEKEATISEEEVRVLMQEGVRAGAFNKVESQIVHSALELDQLAVRDLMTPRPKIIWLSDTEPHEMIWHKIVVSGHTHFPVYHGNRDQVVGIVSLKSIYANLGVGAPVRIRDLMTPPLIVPAIVSAVRLLETFKGSHQHVALVADEFGSVVGLVTLHDVMEAVLGDFPSLHQRSRPEARQRPDGSWLIDGMLDISEVDRTLPGFNLSTEARRGYQTLAGYVVAQFGHLPTEGETFTEQGYLFEVFDMDRHRVDKVLVTPVQGSPPSSLDAEP